MPAAQRTAGPVAIHRTDEEVELFVPRDIYCCWVNNRPFLKLLENDLILRNLILAEPFRSSLPTYPQWELMAMATTPEKCNFFTEKSPGFNNNNNRHGSLEADNAILWNLLYNDFLLSISMRITLPNPTFESLTPYTLDDPFVWMIDNRPLRKLLENDVALAEAISLARSNSGEI